PPGTRSSRRTGTYRSTEGNPPRTRPRRSPPSKRTRQEHAAPRDARGHRPGTTARVAHVVDDPGGRERTADDERRDAGLLLGPRGIDIAATGRELAVGRCRVVGIDRRPATAVEHHAGDRDSD